MTYDTPEKARAAQRARRRERRAAWFAGKVCVHCGGTDRLELDHIDPAAKIASAVWLWRAERRTAELAKCQPLCYACHKAKTFTDMKYGHHGTKRRYSGGCRCAPCREAQRVHMKEYRARKAQKGSVPN